MHGKIDQKQRQSLLYAFNDPNSQAKILLASTKACSEGISLVGASRVVLLDVVWNPSVERQAISRAYRLGQTKVVYTYHLITQGTTECAKYCKQAEKDRISELVFSSKHNENDKTKGSAAVTDDQVLDEMVCHDNLKDMFEKIIYQPKEKDLFENFGL
ncbi:SNF2 domain-containing protein CLASSY 3 [Quillaja saponaria]|uniref:SNF2 domain-containing protein CLASSY 3 n=1 Tax=Quillaja saponaria TaxID=32244 RepID=A0AAD7LPA2_QUISA|nr:SNF2 domain-containing protein CLASSY 3 [Quillaja saponaria]